MISVFLKAIHQEKLRALRRAPSQLKKPFKDSRRRRGICWKEWKKTVFPRPKGKICSSGKSMCFYPSSPPLYLIACTLPDSIHKLSILDTHGIMQPWLTCLLRGRKQTRFGSVGEQFAAPSSRVTQRWHHWHHSPCPRSPTSHQEGNVGSSLGTKEHPGNP